MQKALFILWCENNLESPVPQKRSETMKSPVGTLSGRTVLRSKMEGLCPDKFCGFRGVCVHLAFAAA